MRYEKNVSRNIAVFGIAGLICFLTSSTSMANQAAREYVEDELLVQFKAGVHHEKVMEALSGAEATEDEEISQIRVKKIKVPPAALEKVKSALEKNPHVNFVENNYLANPNAIPNDPSYASQWHLPKISAPAGWDISTGSIAVDIAIIDTGVDPSHPDLVGKLIPGYNFYSNNNDTHDVYGHGTKVAGSAAAIANNAVGVSGVAWQNQVMPLLVSDATGSASYSRIANAIVYAVDHNIRILNISFAGPSSSTTMQSAIDYAWSKGAIVFAGSGNSATSAPYYPAACNHVVAVAATTSSDTLASFSNFGSWITVAAPGSAIMTTTNGGGYASVSGTSFSGPIAAGLGALILSVNPTLSNAQVVDLITKNTDDIGSPGFDTSFGNGRINVFKSLTAAKYVVAQSDTTPPTTSITSPTSNSSVKGNATVTVAATDNVGITKVDLHINGAHFATATTTPYSFLWDTSTTPDGTYTLEAVAQDGSGNIGQSTSVAVKVSNTIDTIAPIVAITSPVNGTKLGTKTTVTIAASDNIGVSKIELYIDGKLQISKTLSTALTYSWNTRSITTGAHALTSKAFDAAGNSATTSITVYK